MFPWTRAVSFTSLLIILNFSYTLGWALYVSRSKFVTNLSQESFCLLLTSVVASAVFIFYYSLSSNFLEFSRFYMICSLFLLNVLFGHPISLNTFSYFVSLLCLNVHLLLILICFVSLSIPSQCLFPLLLFQWSFTLWLYSHLMFS